MSEQPHHSSDPNHGHDHAAGHRHKGFGHKHNTGSLSIDYLAYSSRLRTWNPKFKVLFSLFFLVYCIVANNIWISLIIILTMLWLTVVKGGIELHEYISLMTIPIVFAVLAVVAIAINFAFQPTGDYGLQLGALYVYVTKDSMFTALNILCKAFGAISCMYFMSLSTPVNEIIIVLQGFHVPQLFTELMNMIYRFIFILLEVHTSMSISARSRLGYIDLKTSWYSFGSIAANLFIVSIKKANAYYDALESRCYTGQLVFLREETPVNKTHVLFAVLYAVALTGILIALKVKM